MLVDHSVMLLGKLCHYHGKTLFSYSMAITKITCDHEKTKITHYHKKTFVTLHTQASQSHYKFLVEVRKGHACAIKLCQEKKKDMKHDHILCEGGQWDDVLSIPQL